MEAVGRPSLVLFFSDIQDFSREEVVFWELDERCLDEVAADGPWRRLLA